MSTSGRSRSRQAFDRRDNKTADASTRAAGETARQDKRRASPAVPVLLRKKEMDLGACIAFMVFVVCLLFCMLFFAYDAENMIFDAIAMTLILMIVMITVFSSLTVGLLINIAVIFTYASYLIVMILSQGVTVKTNSYFFMIMSPVLTATVSISFRRGAQLEAQNDELRRMIGGVLIDPRSEMRTMRALEHDLITYRSFAKRFHLETMLVVWTYRFPVELKRMIGQHELDLASARLSEKAKEALRKEDLLYLLSENRWAALMIGSKLDTKSVIRRIRWLLDNRYFAGEDAPRIELRFGAAIDSAKENGEYITADELLAHAEASMEYDV